MDPKRILITSSGHLPSAGLVTMLSSHEGLDVQAAPNSDRERLLQAIVDFQPEVLIMDQATLMETFETLVDLHDGFPRLRTIIVNWDENEIQVCDRQKILIAGITDFLEAL